VERTCIRIVGLFVLMLALLLLEEWAVVLVSCGVALALGFLLK
jgi:hypothetical protein